MVTLIRKDFRFCSKYVLIAITFSLAAPLVLLIDGDNLYIMLSFFIPMVVLGVVLGKICYIEDCEEARLFLRALPYKRRSLVLSKYIESIMLNVISFIYVGIAQYMLMKDVSFGVIFKINLINININIYTNINTYCFLHICIISIFSCCNCCISSCNRFYCYCTIRTNCCNVWIT